MEIIPANITDESVLRLFHEYDDFMVSFLGEDRRLYTRYNGKENIKRVWVARWDSLPIGCIAFRDRTDGIGEVKRLFIKSEYRGRGVSKELLNTIESYAKKEGFHTLLLETRITLEPAVSIYRTVGFTIAFQEGLYIQMQKKL